jgi:LysR family transcriptional regulator, transcriptional activator of the cysJI operon
MDFIFSLKVFSIVAETGKMTTAGESIFLTQPAVSMQIKSLEEFYGVKLFSRRPEGLRLTREGEIVYSYAKKILQNFDLLNEELKTLLKNSKPVHQVNKISIGSCILISEIYMPWLIQKFMSNYPEIFVNCLTMDHDRNIKFLLEGLVDIAFIGHRGHDDIDEKNDLKFEKYLKEQLDIVAPANFDVPEQYEIPVQFLMEKNYIALKTECGINCIFNQLLRKYQIKPEELKKRATFCSGSAVKRAVTSGFGWSILPRNYISQELKEKIVKVVKVKGHRKPFSRWLYLVYLRSKEMDPAVNLFLQFVRSFRETNFTDELFHKALLFKSKNFSNPDY